MPDLERNKQNVMVFYDLMFATNQELAPQPMFPIRVLTVSSADNSSAASPRTSGSSSRFCRDLV